MDALQLQPLNKPINAQITLPGSLSYTIRALNLAAMTSGSVKLRNPLKSDDTYAMVKALQTLGIDIQEGSDQFIVNGSIAEVKDKDYEIDINISGRTARTLLAFLCIVPGIKTLTCREGFKKRPVGDLVDGLRQLGAKIEYLGNAGYLPVKIRSSVLHPGEVSMKGDLSSQYFSAIMMIAPLIGEVTINVTGEQASKPFIDVTIDAMKTCGVGVINKNYKQYIIKGGQTYKKKFFIVEADAISASYFFAIAAVTQSTIRILQLDPDSKQGDIAFADLLEAMGCRVRKNVQEKWIEVKGGSTLKGIEVDMNNTPDTVQTLAVTAGFADGKTTITGLVHLKLKETDRIEAPKNELRKMGIQVEATNDSLVIFGGVPHGARISTYGDHRMAMAFAVAGARIPGIIIENPEVVNKSFPGFWDKLNEIGIIVKYL